jgi:hypothetical protein
MLPLDQISRRARFVAALVSGGCVSFDMDERSYERDLQSCLLATQCRSAGRGRDPDKRTGELLGGFN